MRDIRNNLIFLIFKISIYLKRAERKTNKQQIKMWKRKNKLRAKSSKKYIKNFTRPNDNF